MPITNRTLTPGLVLTARYKKVDYTCTVEQGEGDTLVFVLADGSRHTSLSAAGTAIMGGTIACNGWRFFSRPDETSEKAPKATKPAADAKPARQAKAPRKPEAKAKAKTGGTRVIRKLPNQQGVPADQVRYFCSACMDSFLAPAEAALGPCPQGHPAIAEPTA
jgi:hypothetical protein